MLQALVYWHTSSLDCATLLPPAYVPPFDLHHPRPAILAVPPLDLNFEEPPPPAIARLLAGDTPVPVKDAIIRRVKSSALTSPYGTRSKTFIRGAFIERVEGSTAGKGRVVKLSQDRLASLRHKSIFLVQGNVIPGLEKRGRDDGNDRDWHPDQESPGPRTPTKRRRQKSETPGLSKENCASVGSPLGLSRRFSTINIAQSTHHSDPAADSDSDASMATARDRVIRPRAPLSPLNNAPQLKRLPSFDNFDHVPKIVQATAGAVETTLWALKSRNGNTLAAKDLPAGPSNRESEDLCFKGRDDAGNMDVDADPRSPEYALKDSTAKHTRYIAWCRFHGFM